MIHEGTLGFIRLTQRARKYTRNCENNGRPWDAAASAQTAKDAVTFCAFQKFRRLMRGENNDRFAREIGLYKRSLARKLTSVYKFVYFI
jgi:hypothetical protein